MARRRFSILCLISLAVCAEAGAGPLAEFHSRHYILRTDIQDAREVKQIQAFLEVMHRSYSRVFRSTPVRKLGRASVLIYAAEADFRAFGQKDQRASFNGNWRGYFARTRHELVSYRGSSLTDLFSILSHEGFHQFAWEYMTPDNTDTLPSWFEEGLAEYFRSSCVKRGLLDRTPLRYHVLRVKRAQRENWLWTLPQLWGCNPARLKDPARFDAFYAHAYLFVRFLAEKSRKTLQTIYRLKKQGKQNDEIMQVVFAEGSRDELYAAFCAYVKSVR